MRIAVYTPGRGELLGTLASSGEKVRISGDGSGHERLDAFVAEHFHDGHETPEDFLGEVLASRGFDAAIVPDDVPPAEIWPGHEIDERGHWKVLHPAGLLAPEDSRPPADLVRMAREFLGESETA